MVNVICDERREWCKASSKGIQNFKKSVERMLGIFNAKFALEALSVETNIPVCGVIYEFEQAWYHCVKTITYITLAYILV